MAGDWIKMRTDLHTDPAVIGIACAVGITEDEVVGKLHRVWSWADIQTVDGNAHSVSVSWIDRYLGVSGFAQAMCDAGWLTAKCSDGSAGVMFPNFDRHNGKTAKTRALTAKRVAKHKENTNGDSVSKVTPPALPREEKRREEKSKEDNTCAKSGTNDSAKPDKCSLPVEFPPEFQEFWNAYPNRDGRKRGKQSTLTFWKAIPAADREDLLTATANYAEASRAPEAFIRDPERFLKAGWWRDWIEAPEASEIGSRVPTDEDLANWNPTDGGIGP